MRSGLHTKIISSLGLEVTTVYFVETDSKFEHKLDSSINPIQSGLFFKCLGFFGGGRGGGGGGGGGKCPTTTTTSILFTHKCIICIIYLGML